MVFKICHLRRKDPSLWEKVVVIFVKLFHSHEIAAEVVLAGELIHARDVVYALVRLQLGKLIWEHTLGIVPINIPVSSLIISELIAKHLDRFLNNTVSALTRAEQ